MFSLFLKVPFSRLVKYIVVSVSQQVHSSQIIIVLKILNLRQMKFHVLSAYILIHIFVFDHWII